MVNKDLNFQTTLSSNAGMLQRTEPNVAFPYAIEVSKVLDCRLLSNPLPIIKLRCEVNRLEIGQRLELLLTDLESKKYIPLWCERTGNDFLEISEKCGTTKFVIQRNK